MKKLGLLSTAALAATLLFSAPQSSDAVTLVAVYDAGEMGGSTGFFHATHGANRRAAFEYALARWSDILAGPNNVTIQVFADFPNLGGSVLGFAGPNSITRDFGSAPYAGTWYTGPMREAITGADPNGGVDDIDISFNADIDNNVIPGFSWYYGTNGSPGGNQWDLVTVCMHEIGHGLGFLDLIDSGTGAWASGFPDAYGRQLLRDPGSPSTFMSMTNGQRLSALTSQQVFMNTTDTISGDTSANTTGKLVDLMGGNTRIFAPATYQNGSSISHWHSGGFTPAQQMEPSLVNGIGLHNPGYAVELLMDLGYTQGAEASPAVSFRQGVAATRTATIDEGQSVDIEVFLGAPAASNVTIPLTVTGSGVTGADYTMPASLVINAGDRKGMFTFAANSDAESEGAEIATITLGTPTNGTLEGVSNNWHRFAVTMNNVVASAEDWPLH